MDSVFGSFDSFLSKNPSLAQLANNAISGLTQKSAPKVKTIAPAVQRIEVPADGMSTGMMVGIGAALVGVALVMVMILKRK